MYEAAEYNGKVFLVEIYQTMGNNDRMNSQISYNLSMVYDTLDFDHFAPQTEFSNYLGAYQHVYDEAVDGQVQLVTDTITLNPDHTGKWKCRMKLISIGAVPSFSWIPPGTTAGNSQLKVTTFM
ncbi:hypothetical protein [Butyrivibrio sp. FC2001]|uniref:hypothetical protein n=1 Tax=Butyrivibrio sp. FC2001 TaxID=1280671 RepID=UPI00047BF794|nr:hypothetical protein [Butyrivibrio sp. FC2001]